MTQGNGATPDSGATSEGRCLRVHSERTNGTQKVRLQGEMDLSVVGMVDREVRIAEEGDAPRIVLDLDQLEFVDASGLRLLMHLNARARDRLRVRRGSSAQVRRMLELSGLDEVLRFAD